MSDKDLDELQSMRRKKKKKKKRQSISRLRRRFMISKPTTAAERDFVPRNSGFAGGLFYDF